MGTPTAYSNGPLTVHVGAQRVTIAGKAVEVPARHYEILLLLIEHLGKPVTRQMIARVGWRRTWAGRWPSPTCRRAIKNTIRPFPARALIFWFSFW